MLYCHALLMLTRLKLGAAHALIGLVVVVLGAITIGVATRKRWQTAVVTAVVTVCGILAAVAAVRMFRPVSMQVLAICVLVGLLVLIRMTPTVALWVARVRPPHFGSITGRDLFARRAGMPVDTVAPVSEADADDEDNELTDITARGTAIAASARLVNAVQVGMCVGVSLVLPAAVWGVLTPRQPWAWLALLVAGLTVGLFTASHPNPLNRSRRFPPTPPHHQCPDHQEHTNPASHRSWDRAVGDCACPQRQGQHHSDRHGDNRHGGVGGSQRGYRRKHPIPAVTPPATCPWPPARWIAIRTVAQTTRQQPGVLAPACHRLERPARRGSC